MKWVQVYDPLGNIFLSALIAAIPLMILLYMLGVRRAKGHHAAMIGTGEQGVENAKIQLLAPLNENSTIAKFIDKNGPGIQQLAYRVADLDHVSEVLRERGLRLLYPEAKRGTAGSRINFVHPKDARGVLLELVELALYPRVYLAEIRLDDAAAAVDAGILDDR